MSSGAIGALMAQKLCDRNLLCAQVSQTTMPRFRTLIPTALLSTILLVLAGASVASASHSQVTYFEGGTAALNPATRPKAIEQMQSLGVHALRIELYWATVAPAPESATKPVFDATNPASYNWSEYDGLIAEAQRLHWPVLLTLTSPVPSWATSNHKAPYITRPDQRDFQEFATAVARHFGSRVATYSIWNEPNHPAFLLPQWNSNGTPASPRIYRGLYQSGYEGLKAGGVAHPKVLFGETAPTGYDKVNVKREGSLHDVAPLDFLREALCLTASYKKKSGSCSELPMSGYAHHAYTLPAGPTYVDPMKDSVQIGTLSRLSQALDKAARVHAIPAHLPIYLTEFGVQSVPNQLGVPLAKQAEFDAISERIAYDNPRVAAFSQYLLEDDTSSGTPGGSVHGGTVGFQTGLETGSGKLKPLYQGWPVPLAVQKKGSRYSLWGLARPATGTTKVTVLIRKKGSSAYKTLKTVTTNSRGYWTLNSSVAGAYWRVRWKSPQGRIYEGPPVRSY
jgi:hypothetical protein